MNAKRTIQCSQVHATNCPAVFQANDFEEMLERVWGHFIENADHMHADIREDLQNMSDHAIERWQDKIALLWKNADPRHGAEKR